MSLSCLLFSPPSTEGGTLAGDERWRSEWARTYEGRESGLSPIRRTDGHRPDNEVPPRQETEFQAATVPLCSEPCFRHLGGRSIDHPSLFASVTRRPRVAASRRRGTTSGRLGIVVCIVVATLALTSAISFVSHSGVSRPLPSRRPSGLAGLCGSRGVTCPDALGAAAPSATVSDLTVTSTASTSFTGNATAFQATLPAGVTATGYAWWWGNGNVSSTSGDSTSYAYPVAGIYLVYVQAVDSSGGVHDNLHNLLRRTVLASATNDVLGNYPGVAGSLVANTSTNVNATGAIAPGGFVTVENWIAGSPSDPQWTPSTPSYSVDPAVRPYTTLSASIVNVTGINGVTAAFAANTPNGSYWLEFSVPSSGPTGSGAGTVWANFSFTVFVENGSGVVAVSLPTSPHRGSLDVYAATSPYTLDPVLVYETAGSVDQNFLQTLILRNVSQDGSSPQDFVPNLATCVPGSALCQLLYGQSLVTSSGNFTFVLNPNASFYNATSGAHWQVQADDVAYSISRDSLETDYPTVETFPGWDLCQMLLPGPSAPRNASNLSWDGGLHYPYNSTPSNILSAVLVNDSLACPVGSHLRDGVHGNGCVTFVTSRTGHAWPQFLDPLATSWGAGILGCSWTGRSLDPARLPGWWNGSGCSPVEPGQPGGPAMPNDTAWDPMEEATAGTAYGAIGDAVAFDPVGSGPYAILSSSVSMGMLTEIQLTANPYWGGTPCIGGPLAGCLPPSNVGSANPSYFSSVTIYLNISGNSTLGMQSLASGTADLVDPNVNDLPTLLSYQGQGVAQIAGVPGITVLQLGMNLNYSISTADSILGASSTLPST